MAEIIIMPKLGFNMNEGRIVKWHVAEGDAIKKSQPMFSIETDKTTIDIEATGAGVVRRILLEEGGAVPVTMPVAIVAEADEDIEALLTSALSQLGRESEKESRQEPSAGPAAAAPQAASTNGGESSEPVTQRDYEIVVIGGGPGGYVAAIKAAQMGKKTAIVEKEHLGGVCLNRGCIPTKALLRSAEALREVKECESFGVAGVSKEQAYLDMQQVQKRKSSIVSQLVGGVEGLLKANGVSAYRGRGELLDPHTVKVGDQKLTSDYIVIATGSKVKSLPIPADPKMKVITSDEALNLTEIPQNIVIIGGGVIGIEFAYFLACAGSKVTVIEFLDGILPMVDEEITKQAAAMLEEMGITIHTGARVTGITASSVEFEKAGTASSVNASTVLMAVGREPDFQGIGAEALNLKIEKGALSVDEKLRTSIENIYAIGDVNGKSMLAHTASMEAIVAVENICGQDQRMSYQSIPSAIYIQPEIACVGLTEAQAKEKYGTVKTGTFPLLASGKAKVAGEQKGLIKVVLEPKLNEVVGVHLYCIHATEMIAEAVLAIDLEASAEEVVRSVHPHPTVSESLQEAFHAALDKAIHSI